MYGIDCHDVRAVRIEEIIDFPRVVGLRPAFVTRLLVITNTRGEQMRVNLFASKAEMLMLHDACLEPIERIPDPPDCTACGGDGITRDPSGCEVGPCGACGGEGVAQF
jgi:hypothetical protein